MAATAQPTKRYAVVTGGNRGIGYEICRQLAAKGIVVLLTARDDKRGLEAVHKLRHECKLTHSQLLFHQLDVTDIASVSSLADFVRTQFGKLDILVNNAGIVGVIMHEAALRASGYGKEGAKVNWNEVTTQNYELAEKCLETNYYGAKRMVEALISLLQLSDSPRIVNVSSFMGMLKNVPNEWAKGILSDVEKLTEERVEMVLREFLSDFKELGCGTLRSKGWPSYMAANIVSKASMNAYTRILAKRYPNFCINSVCPTSVKTDINFNMGILPVEEGAASPLRLALLPNGGPTGRFFIRFKDSSF